MSFILYVLLNLTPQKPHATRLNLTSTPSLPLPMFPNHTLKWMQNRTYIIHAPLLHLPAFHCLQKYSYLPRPSPQGPAVIARVKQHRVWLGLAGEYVLAQARLPGHWW